MNQAWRADAECAGLDPDLFFLDLNDNPAAAAQVRATCARCPVRTDCLEHALLHEPHGFWGGKSPQERRQIRRRRRRAPAPDALLPDLFLVCRECGRRHDRFAECLQHLADAHPPNTDVTT